jgi:hypothetical protein
MGYREGQLYIAFPVNAVYDHSVLKFEDMTEDDYIKTSEARCDVLKKLFPSVDFTVEQLVNATKEVAAGNNAPIEFECGGNKCIINCLYDGVSVAIVLP